MSGLETSGSFAAFALARTQWRLSRVAIAKSFEVKAYIRKMPARLNPDPGGCYA
jgi:hypothetical protein